MIADVDVFSDEAEPLDAAGMSASPTSGSSHSEKPHSSSMVSARARASRDTLDREFLESRIEALTRMSKGTDSPYPLDHHEMGGRPRGKDRDRILLVCVQGDMERDGRWDQDAGSDNSTQTPRPRGGDPEDHFTSERSRALRGFVDFWRASLVLHGPIHETRKFGQVPQEHGTPLSD